MKPSLFLFSTFRHYPYDCAMELMSRLVQDVRLSSGNKGYIWLLEHEPVITKAYRTPEEDLPKDLAIPVVATNRGGKATYHGPGQRIAYCVVPTPWFANNPKRYVANLEQWVINTLASFGVEGFRDDLGHGVWVKCANHKQKIAAVGVRMSMGVASHGVAINIHNDLKVYDAFVPCGIQHAGVTNLKTFIPEVSMYDWDAAFQSHAINIFPAELITLTEVPHIFLQKTPEEAEAHLALKGGDE